MLWSYEAYHPYVLLPPCTHTESGYVMFTNVIMLLLLYKFTYFLQFRPVTRFLSKRQFGTKFHYRYPIRRHLRSLHIHLLYISIFRHICEYMYLFTAGSA